MKTVIVSMFVVCNSFAQAAPDGAQLYRTHCAMCHQAEGQGVPGVFPPLAKADFLSDQRERSLRAPLEGISGQIHVNGKEYNGSMPVTALKDDEVAAVMTWIFTHWDNQLPPVTIEEVSALRAKTKYPTWEKLMDASALPAVPPAPSGWELTNGVALSFQPVRMISEPGGPRALILAASGDVWAWTPGSELVEPFLMAAQYIEPKYDGIMALGLLIDKSGRLYVSGNQTDKVPDPVESVVTVWRSKPLQPSRVPEMESWLTARYPHGIGGFNHGVSDLKQGPDGMIYLASGSRTDGNEPGGLPRHFKGGEVPLTACVWRIDPASDKPSPSVWCRGVRNPYGLCFDPQGRLWCSDNGPDADRPEELNQLTEGAHHGFPYQFAHFPLSDRPYAYTPVPPDGLSFAPPLMNVGPDAGGKPDAAIGTFDPHSCPCGFIWIDGPAYPLADRGSFFVTRYGNLLAHKDCGFDLVRVRPLIGGKTAAVDKIVGPLARPIDILEYVPGRLLIAEYCRGTNFEAGLGQPGRILDLKVGSNQ